MTSTPLNYKPKHRGRMTDRGIDGKTPRGPLRWVRAYANAVENPNSKGARILHQRIALAHAAREKWGDVDTAPSVFLKWPYDYQIQRGARNEPKVLYYTCLSFCTAMQVQLDFPDITTLEDLEYFYETDERVTRSYVAELLYGLKQTRTVRCQVCAAPIRKKR